MKAHARQPDYASCPEALLSHVTPGQTFITPGKSYEVHAIATFEGRLALQVINDIGYPAWENIWLFSGVEGELPRDWICTAHPNGPPELILGPEFIARDQESYVRMVELESEQVRLFWQRISLLEAHEAERA